MKNRIFKSLYVLTEIILIAIIVVSIYFNYDKTTDYYCAILQSTYHTKLIYLTTTFVIIGFIAGYIFNQILKTKMFDLFEAYQKRHESSSIQKDTDNAKILRLEAKIATLEAALESALKNK